MISNVLSDNIKCMTIIDNSCYILPERSDIFASASGDGSQEISRLIFHTSNLLAYFTHIQNFYPEVDSFTKY